MEQPKKVLVLETDKVVLALMSHVLQRESYEVDGTVDPKRAAELTATNRYAAYLINVADGGMELAHGLAEHDAELARRIIVVTATMKDLPRLNGLDVHSVVKKPVDISELIETVADCAGRRA